MPTWAAPRISEAFHGFTIRFTGVLAGCCCPRVAVFGLWMFLAAWQTMVNLLAWSYRHLLGEWLDFYQFEVSFVIPHKFLRKYPTFAMVSSLNMFLAVPRNSQNLHDTSTSWCFGGTPGAGVSQKALNRSGFLVAFMHVAVSWNREMLITKLFTVFSWYSNSNWANCYEKQYLVNFSFFLFYLPNYIAVISLVLGACCHGCHGFTNWLPCLKLEDLTPRAMLAFVKWMAAKCYGHKMGGSKMLFN